VCVCVCVYVCTVYVCKYKKFEGSNSMEQCLSSEANSS